MTSKSLVERLVDFRIYALSVLGYIVFSYPRQTKPLKEESYAVQCTTAGRYNALPTDLSRAGSVCGLGSDVHGIHITSLAARFRTAARSAKLANGPAEIWAARQSDRVILRTHTPAWKRGS